jgi:superfamily II DNA or RNA helicase
MVRGLMSVDLEGTFRAIRTACSSRSWSRGIELQRADAVDGVASNDEEITLRVKVPAQTVSPMVSLWPEDEEWDCDCDSTADACEHVAAAIIALRRARKEGKSLPTSQKAGGRVGYRLRPDGDRIEIGRVVVSGSTETALVGSLAKTIGGDGPGVEPDKVDLSIDRLLSMHRVRSLHADTVVDLVPLLAEAEDVQIDGEKVRVDAKPVGPLVTVSNHDGGFRLRLEAPRALDRAVGAGLGIFRHDEGAMLRPLALVDVGGPRYERLPVETQYARQRVAELVSDVLPRMREHGEVVVEAKGLPKAIGRKEARRLEPSVLLRVEQRGGALTVMPLLVYGDPPCARVDGDNMVHLGGPVPKRDRRGEQRALARLREDLDMVPGRRVEVMGRDAIGLSRKLRKWKGPVDGDAHRTRYPASALAADVDLDPTGFTASFAKGELEADPADVMRAWQRGDDAVSLLGGGWAELPVQWLATHGDRVAALLAAKRADGSVAPHARPAMAQLCDALERPRPPQLQALAPLVDGFDALPAASLPRDLDAELRPYQRQGVAWLQFMQRAELGAVLADDMGLGKTIQALCCLQAKSRVLVVAPRSVVHNWIDEIERFRPSLSHALYHGVRRQIDADVDVVVTTYSLLRNDIEALEAVHWDAVVLDEAQTIKNPDSQVTRAAYRLNADFRLTLSGTPVENRLDELWSQLHFVNPGMLGGRQDFAERYEKPLLAGEPGAGKRLRERIKPFVLRRTKNEVLTDLPPRTDTVLTCELDETERTIYDAIQLSTRNSVVARLGEGGNVMEALEALLRLRQAACDAALVPGQAATMKERASSKIKRLVLALEDASAGGHKSLVFSQWTSLLDRLEPELGRSDIDFCRLDGSTRDRGGVVARFQDPAGPPVMIISLKAGGTGLNLTAADHVFMLDPWWNPAVEDQAADRAHRIGQERPVSVYRLVAKDTVEEGILRLQERKRAVADAALGEADRAASLTRDDLLALLE